MRFVVMAGDGIGEEITEATLKVLRAADGRFGLGLEYEEAEIGLKALAKHGPTLPDGVLERARASDGIILGPKIGRADVRTPVTNAHLVCRLQPEKKQPLHAYYLVESNNN